MATTARRLVPGALLVALLALAGAACGGDGDGENAGDTTTSEATTSTEPADGGDGSSDDGASTTTGTPGAATGDDACEVLPADTITSVLGKDPGTGELEEAGTSTVCHYYGDARVTVEIDEGSVMEDARSSIEAYGETCEAITGIGQDALFCTGGSGAEGLTGQVVWTDGEQTYYVVVNFGDQTPSRDVVMQLAGELVP